MTNLLIAGAIAAGGRFKSGGTVGVHRDAFATAVRRRTSNVSQKIFGENFS